MRKVLLALMCGTFLGCAVHSFRMPIPYQLLISQRWYKAQQALAGRTEGKSFDVPYTMFKWRFYKKQRIEQKGDESIELLLGYFNWFEMEIGINEYYLPGLVVEHEACHAILFVLKDHGAHEYCHSEFTYR